MQDTYIIRIIEPPFATAQAEVEPCESLDVAVAAMERVAARIRQVGIDEFLIHVVNSVTGDTVRTLRYTKSNEAAGALCGE